MEAVSHAEAAKAIDGSNAQAFAWYGQAIQAKAKAVDGTFEQARATCCWVASAACMLPVYGRRRSLFAHAAPLRTSSSAAPTYPHTCDRVACFPGSGGRDGYKSVT